MSEKEKTKKNIIADICNGLVLLSAVIIAGKGLYAENLDTILVWSVIPFGFLALSVIYRLPEIGAGIVSIIKYLDIGGMPIIGLIILIILFGFYLFSKESKILEIVKYFVGFIAGAFAQKKRSVTN